MVSALDGNFKRDFPRAEKVSWQHNGKWFVAERGPRYVNSYEVTEFDEAGLAWLRVHNTDDPPAEKPL